MILLVNERSDTKYASSESGIVIRMDSEDEVGDVRRRGG